MILIITDGSALFLFARSGPAQESLLIELVEMRASLQPYLITELAKLSGAGRPLNRPLNFDFPEDSVTWQLAEKGLGTQNNRPAATDRPAQLGDVIEVVPCGSAPAWTKHYLDSSNSSAGAPFMLTLEKLPGLCVDSVRPCLQSTSHCLFHCRFHCRFHYYFVRPHSGVQLRSPCNTDPKHPRWTPPPPDRLTSS